MTDRLKNSLIKVRESRPLVYCITNYVAAEWTANALLAIGALPIMSYAKEEAEETAEKSDAVLINIGTPDADLAETVLIAGKTANKKGVPLVFDPVGAGFTRYRLDICREILSGVRPDIIKGNEGEISALLGGKSLMKGVESIKTNTDLYVLSRKTAEKYHCVCAVTGETDYISNNSDTFINNTGHELLTRVAGTGCVCGALCGAFASLGDPYMGAVNAVELMCLAGEYASEKCSSDIGSFKYELLNYFSNWEKKVMI